MRILTPAKEDFINEQSPYYLPIGEEIELFEAAHKERVPLLLKGPTGCGKTRFISYMAHKLQRPLITVACHEDLTASDLIGRYLIQGDETLWSDGPMSAAVRMGAILYLDEVVEARKDTIVAIHPLTDHRRMLSIDKLAAVLEAPPEFMLVVSYNPGYQSLLKEMKPSTRQRFVSLCFDYPDPEAEAEIIEREANISSQTAQKLAKLAVNIRNLSNRGLEEGVSTRLLVHAGRLISSGIQPRSACNVAFAQTLTDDPDIRRSIQQLALDFF
jgi:nitric oxide reductase NorQ protein